MDLEAKIFESASFHRSKEGMSAFVENAVQNLIIPGGKHESRSHVPAPWEPA